MSFDPYYDARRVLQDFLRQDLVGPVKEDEQFSDTDPIRYYAAGILYPQGYGVEAEEQERGEFSDPNEMALNLCNSSNPSSLAVSFTVRPGVRSVLADVRFATYEATDKQKRKPGEHRYVWKRVPGGTKQPVQIELCEGPPSKTQVASGLEVHTFMQKEYNDGSRTFTIALVNTNEASGDLREDNVRSFFQTQLDLFSHEGENNPSFIEKQLRVELKRDPEVLTLEMLYRHHQVFAIGHGCSVDWEAENGIAHRIRTEVMPTHELLQMRPADMVDKDLLSWRFLGYGEQPDICDRLKEIPDKYEAWLKQRRNEMLAVDFPEKYHTVAALNLEQCEKTLRRLQDSVKALGDLSSPYLFEAFQLANRAMLEQRIQVLRSKNETFDEDMLGWYPFQLAFLLQEMPSVANDDHVDRELVDLLWFPTGGGKTEAYLGIAAFTIFHRRLIAIKEGRSGAGVTILMRYTLRLLTFQQFERASALICACEKLRRLDPGQLGPEEIAIGLWVGELTPNKRDVAEKTWNKHIIGEDLSSDDSDPCQVLACPWCGTTIKPQNYRFSADRMTICCPNEACDYRNGLPLYLIDEDIYEYVPSLIVGTVDKFARMTWEPLVGEIFGLHSEHLPPQLIIQDELHLISGPLGTITGLYEIAIDMFCSQQNIRPKIIASTATIRNAESQILNLYGRRHHQFPPQGLTIRDSFFAVESERNDKASRAYVGIMGPGKSTITMMVRIFGVMLFATRYLKDLGFEDRVIDSFWTVTGYFNSLRQLGGANVRILDDVQDRFNYLYGTKFKHVSPSFTSKRPYDHFDELTSRKKSSEIAQVLKQLEKRYPDEAAFHFIMASNMISVGVDVDRLSLMFVHGQPKSNAEYIQATSRVGRKTPGLVLTLLDSFRSRDRSHYEQFKSFHSTMYKHVEATSLTPFSPRARERALHAVLISMCRHLIVELRNNLDAGYLPDVIDQVKPFISFILDKVERIDKKELASTREDLAEILNYWELLAKTGRLVYSRYGQRPEQPIYLIKDPVGHEEDALPTLNTMRNVDTESVVYVEGI